MIKVCTKCKLPQQTSEFSACGHTRDKLQSWCKSCTLVAARLATRRYRRRNRDRINTIKRDRGCIDCGSREDLEFDHRDPNTKVANVSRLRTRPWSVIEAEIAKCDVRCRSCHVAKTTEQGEWGPRG